uniref:(northern house mosquito) hypothetical protein n=1 Tax=Culex pipiens TaxID=7175 RepID=A0A8D8GIB0_CULPI
MKAPSNVFRCVRMLLGKQFIHKLAQLGVLQRGARIFHPRCPDKVGIVQAGSVIVRDEDVFALATHVFDCQMVRNGLIVFCIIKVWSPVSQVPKLLVQNGQKFGMLLRVAVESEGESTKV